MSRRARARRDRRAPIPDFDDTEPRPAGRGFLLENAMPVTWIPTSAAVYSAIRSCHHQRMQVFGTITDMGEHSSQEHIMTEWGLPGADYPLVKVDSKDGIASYWIAVITKEQE